MTSNVHITDAGTDPVIANLAHVLERISDLEDVTEKTKTNMASNIRTLCRVLQRHPRQVPVAAPAFRRVIEDARPAAEGIKPRHWKNVVSSTRRAINAAGLGGKKPALDVPLSSDWEALVSHLENRWVRNAVGRFASFCSAHQLAPDQVDDVVVERYRQFLEETQLTKDPAKSIASLILHWNRCVEEFSDWPSIRLTRPDRTNHYALSWDDLPPTLEQEAKDFYEQSLNPDPLDFEAPRPVKPRTAKTRDASLRRLAAAIVIKGVSKDELRSLANLVRPDRVKLGLRFFLDRSGGKPTSQIYAIADLAFRIARTRTDLGEDELRELERLRRRFKPKHQGMTEKNKSRIRQFHNERSTLALFDLPRVLVAQAKTMPPSRKRALRVQTALAIQILLFSPIRLGNLVGLDRQRHFLRTRHKGKDGLHLCIPAGEVKNDVDLEFPLPEETVELLNLYMTTYQPDLVPEPNSFLFPGQKGGPKDEGGFWRQITKTIRHETGLEVNPHLFRHLAGFFHLSHQPGEYEVVRRVLGHKSINTTTQNYLGMETAAAVQRFDESVLAIRDKVSSLPRIPEVSR